MRKISLTVQLACLLLTSSIVNAAWTPTAHSDGTTGCLLTVGSDVFVGQKDPSSGLYKISNNGTTQVSSSTGIPSGTGVYSIILVGSTLYAATDVGVYKSTNNGSNWTSSGLDTLSILALTSTSAGIFAGSYSKNKGVFKSVDNGATWSKVSTGLPNSGVYYLASAGTTLVVGYWNALYRSLDNGASWASVGSVSPTALVSNGTNFFTGITSGRTYVSTDNGATWPESKAFFGGYVSTFAFIGNYVIVAGLGSGVGVSTNGGDYVSQNTALNYNQVTALAICGDYIYCGATAGGVWKRPLSEIGVAIAIENSHLKSSDNSGLNISPNPVTSLIKINNKINGSLAIVDLQGRLITSESSINQNSTINLTHVPKGTYLVKVKTKEGATVKRIVKE